jgi:hypothetical protein
VVCSQENGIGRWRQHQAAERDRVVLVCAAASYEPAGAQRRLLKTTPLPPRSRQDGYSPRRRGASNESRRRGDESANVDLVGTVLAGGDLVE